MKVASNDERSEQKGFSRKAKLRLRLRLQLQLQMLVSKQLLLMKATTQKHQIIVVINRAITGTLEKLLFDKNKH